MPVSPRPWGKDGVQTCDSLSFQTCRKLKHFFTLVQTKKNKKKNTCKTDLHISRIRISLIWSMSPHDQSHLTVTTPQQWGPVAPFYIVFFFSSSIVSSSGTNMPWFNRRSSIHTCNKCIADVYTLVMHVRNKTRCTWFCSRKKKDSVCAVVDCGPENDDLTVQQFRGREGPKWNKDNQ